MAPSTPPMEDAEQAQADSGDAGGAQVARNRYPDPPACSALRRPGGARNSYRRISYVDTQLVLQYQVTSYRHVGERLWYYMPGTVVTCDNCDNGVSPTTGSMQGAPNQSQFAQNTFLCSSCMGAQQVPRPACTLGAEEAWRCEE